MVLGVKARRWLSPEWLFASGGRYVLGGLSVVAILTSIFLLLSNPTFKLHLMTDPKVEAHLAECEGCRNRAIGEVWNHIPPSQDRASSIQSHLDACASCRQKVVDLVHEHTQIQSPLGGKSRWGVPKSSR